jgi:hypothetical protein
MTPLLYSLKKTIISIFSGRNFFFHILAIFLTYIIVMSGFDWYYFIHMQSSPLLPFLTPAIGIGGLIPMFGVPLVYLYTKFRHNKVATLRVWAVTQAVMLGWIISSIYKAFTGRVQPPHGVVSTLVDSSHDWNFGFFEHGIFWGWPSSHTTVAFAMSFTAIALFPKNKKVLFVALLYAFYIGLGVVTRIHWFSEFVAGGIIGAMIGYTVGQNFYKKLNGKTGVDSL